MAALSFQLHSVINNAASEPSLIPSHYLLPRPLPPTPEASSDAVGSIVLQLVPGGGGD